ncbi:uncharacterized protein EV422DRAFT_570308 [Fimicolochytrium jonesii]|uniref:uncharacterized protein n=1 Tax=Fimicolochytrium jonesii TaxID=1396493 RepID=UPI0022FEC667|nr:uncharacterized protein EV422DRAFT_570308 [Fimicolochytrium jonesii]KAI8817828.1 hypothetical protein EV422DRAFT_570308 [Fimicolochytrium jonesii]
MQHNQAEQRVMFKAALQEADAQEGAECNLQVAADKLLIILQQIIAYNRDSGGPAYEKDSKTAGKNPSQMPLLTTLILDYDGTITQKDTLHLLSAVACAPCTCSSPGNRPPSSPPNEVCACKRQHQQWDALVSQYLDDYERTAALATLQTNPSANSTATISGSPSALTDYLQSFTPVESASIARVAASRVLAGATRAAMRQAGASVETREGWWDVVEVFRSAGKDVVVCSVNWSDDLIKGTVDAAAGGSEGDVMVISNSLVFEAGDKDRGEVSTGLIRQVCVTGVDKLHRVAEYMAARHFDGQDPTTADRTGATHLRTAVAIGDSVSDLPLLTHAGLGILIQPSASVASACERFGIPVRPLTTLMGGARTGEGGDGEDGWEWGTVHVAEDGWKEIRGVLERMME